MKGRLANRVNVALGVIGKTFITAGLLLLGLVAYQLWGTGIETRRAQDKLHAEFTRLVAEQTTGTTGQPSSSTATTTPTATVPNRPNKALALLEVPTAGIADVIVEGVSVSALRHGPGHVPRTALPGEPGNSAIAGHRTTYGAPFADLDRVRIGDEATVTTLKGKFVYEVINTKIIKPNQTDVLQPVKNKTLLTLITCNPRYSTSQRLIVVAELRKSLPLIVDTTSTPTIIGGTTTSTSTTIAVTPTTSVTPDVAASANDGIEQIDGWFSDRAAIVPAVLLGIGLAGLAFATRCLRIHFTSAGRGSTRARLTAYAITAAPFLVVLFFWYRYINLLLPAST